MSDQRSAAFARLLFNKNFNEYTKLIRERDGEFSAEIDSLKAQLADVKRLAEKWRRMARVDSDPANGNPLIQLRGHEISKCADELFAVLKPEEGKQP